MSMRFPALTHIALTVRDLDRSLAWYERLFGTPPVIDHKDPTFRWAVWLQPSFGLHEHDDTLADDFSERRMGLDHVAFGCADRDELVTWEARLDELGVEHGAIVDAFYGSALAFRDPDGIALELFAPPAAR